MICVIAAIDVAEGRREEFLDIFHKLVPTVRAEAAAWNTGRWSIFSAASPASSRSVPTPWSWWRSGRAPAALEAHLAAAHMQEFFAATEGLRTGLALQILQPA